MRTGPLRLWEAAGGKVWSPSAKTVLVEGMAFSDDVGAAVRLMDEIIVQVERPGWEERCDYAEFLRIKGWMFQQKGDTEGAQDVYQ